MKRKMRLNAAGKATLLSIPLLLPLHDLVRAGPGIQANLNVSQRLESTRDTDTGSDSTDGVRAITNLRFGLDSVTRAQEFSFDLGTGLAYRTQDGDGFEVDQWNSALGYTIRGSESRFSLRLDYREAGVDDSFLLDVIDTETGAVEFVEISSSGGTRNTLNGTLEYVYGEEGPATYTLRYNRRDQSFSGTLDPDLVDSLSESFLIAVDLDITPVFSLETRATRNTLEQESATGTDRTTDRFSVSGRYQLRPATSVSAGFNISDVETNTGATDDGGLGYSFGLNHTVPNGSYGLNFSSTEEVSGTRRQINFNRAYEMPWGSASLALGASKTDGLSIEPLVNLGLEYAASRNANLNLQIQQRSTVNNSDQETLRTQISLGHSLAVNSRSSLNTSVQYIRQNELATDSQQDTLQASLSYRYDLGDDWNLVSGYEYRKIDSTTDDRTRQSIFLTLQKNFAW